MSPQTHVSPMLPLAAMLIGLLPMSVPTQSARWGEQASRGLLTDARLAEISGLVASAHAEPLRFWAHNDSGDLPRLFLITERGELAAEVALPDLEPFDLEDITAGPCSAHDPRRCLFLGDIGDNRHRREIIALYRIVEPDLSAGTLPASLPVDATIVLRHPQGRAHDVETLMYDVRRGELLLMEKSRDGVSRLLRVPREALDAPDEHVYELEPVGTLDLSAAPLPARLITAGEISADGTCMILNSYSELLTACRKPDEPWQHALARPPERVLHASMLQSEALAIDPRDGALWITSELRFAPLLRIAPATLTPGKSSPK